MLISVIIPTYNRKDLLEKAIQSVLNQTYKKVEIIVSDDGSTDGTEKFIKEKYPQVKFLSNKHSGLPATPRNVAMKLTKGKYVAFLDSDDKWDNKKLEKQLAEIQKREISFCCTNAKVIDGTNKLIKDKLIETNKKEFDFFDILKENKIICSSVLISKNLLKQYGGFPENNSFRGFEDYGLWLKLLLGYHAFFIDEPLVTYTDDPENSIRKNGPNTSIQTRIVLDYINKEIKKRGIASWIKCYPFVLYKKIQIHMCK